MTSYKSTPSRDTNGDYWIDASGELWRQVTFCDAPTASLRNVKTGERMSGACGAPIFDQFTRLVPENFAQHQTGPGASLLEDRGTGARKGKSK